jgi:hypothetical protein
MRSCQALRSGSPKGGKSFILEKRIRGRMRHLTIGPYGPLTVDQARKVASMHVGAIAQGDDPAQVRQDRLHEPTFEDLTEQYLKRHAPRKRSARDDRGMPHTHLVVFRTRKLTDLNRNDVARFHAQVGRRFPYRANRLMACSGRCSIWLWIGACMRSMLANLQEFSAHGAHSVDLRRGIH